MRCPKPRIAYCSQQPWIRNESLRETRLIWWSYGHGILDKLMPVSPEAGKKAAGGLRWRCKFRCLQIHVLYMFLCFPSFSHHFSYGFSWFSFARIGTHRSWTLAAWPWICSNLSHGDLTEIGERGITLSGGEVDGSTDLGWIWRNGCREFISVSSWFVCTPPLKQ